MIDYHAELVSALKTILPVHYERALTAETKTPCISYMELTNVDTVTGDTLGYSEISYQVKVWANKISDIQNYTLQVDRTLRPLGWKRVGSAELGDKNSTMIQKVLTYQALGRESFN
jgi:hypothetical protein